MTTFAIYILLVLAVAAGWLLGRLGTFWKRRSDSASGEIFSDYFVGLNYLLNDEPDEAIDTFIKALEINSETIETHLALGALLRRRGKVDKAIKVHHALLARPGLSMHFADATRLQLAIDYISAGLLDRAERLLNEVLDENRPAKWDALRHLITIYQTEKEWEKAIGCVSLMLANNKFKRDEELRVAAAHYACELTEMHLAAGQKKKAKEQIKRAFAFDRKSVRASLLLAEIESRSGNFKAAVRELLRVRSSKPEFIGRLLSPLRESYEKLGEVAEYEKLLRSLLTEKPDIGVVLALSSLVEKTSGEAAAIGLLNQSLLDHPSLSGTVELLRLQLAVADPGLRNDLSMLQQMIEKLMLKKPAYQCHHCGYESKNSYWMCPSCQKWEKIKPILEVDGS